MIRPSFDPTVGGPFKGNHFDYKVTHHRDGDTITTTLLTRTGQATWNSEEQVQSVQSLREFLSEIEADMNAEREGDYEIMFIDDVPQGDSYPRSDYFQTSK